MAGLDRPESAQFSVQHPPAEVAPAGAAGPGVGEDIPERERGPPVLYDDVAHRRSVRERDEWLWLFSSMASYRPIFPRSWIRDILEGEGCHCVDLNTLTFIAFLLDVYAHRIVDHAMDWAFVRLTGEEEDKGDADPKYKKQHVGDKILAGNFTVERVDVLHALNEMEPGGDVPYIGPPKGMMGDLSSEDDDEDSSATESVSSSGMEADGELRDGKVDPEALRELVRESPVARRRKEAAAAAEAEESSDGSSLGHASSSASGEGAPLDSSDERERERARGRPAARGQPPGSMEDTDDGAEGVSGDLDRFIMQQELATELPGSDPECQEEGYYAVTGLMSDGVDELEFMSPWGPEAQDDSGAAEVFQGDRSYPGVQGGYGGAQGGVRDGGTPEAVYQGRPAWAPGRDAAGASGGGYYAPGGQMGGAPRQAPPVQYAHYAAQQQQHYSHDAAAAYQVRQQVYQQGAPPAPQHATYPAALHAQDSFAPPGWSGGYGGRPGGQGGPGGYHLHHAQAQPAVAPGVPPRGLGTYGQGMPGQGGAGVPGQPQPLGPGQPRAAYGSAGAYGYGPGAGGPPR